MRRIKVSLPAAFAMLALLVGCAAGDGAGDDGASSDGAPLADGTAPAEDSIAEPEDAGPTPAEWTIGITDVDHVVTGAALLTDVDAGRNEGFDRVVLEFETDAMPSYHVEYIDRPVVACGSGEPVEIEGDGWLAVRLEPANAHTWEGQSTVEERSFEPGLPVLRQVTLTCDFEAQVQWVLGVSAPNRYRVMELAEPTRLVIDVRH